MADTAPGGTSSDFASGTARLAAGVGAAAIRVVAGLLNRAEPTDDGRSTVVRMFTLLPRPLRFLAVGGIGLATDLTLFTLVLWAGLTPLAARPFSLVAATAVTWRLNRVLTFDRSGRRQHDEATRYAVVTAIAQGTSYAVFAALVLTVFVSLPQAALLAGAAVGAAIAYQGHRRIAFAPKKPGAAPAAAMTEWSSR